MKHNIRLDTVGDLIYAVGAIENLKKLTASG